MVKSTDIGDVKKVVIWHDNGGLGPDWHLQQVDVFNPATQVGAFLTAMLLPRNRWGPFTHQTRGHRQVFQ